MDTCNIVRTTVPLREPKLFNFKLLITRMVLQAKRGDLDL